MKVIKLLLFACVFALCACGKDAGTADREKGIDYVCKRYLGAEACKKEININDLTYDKKTDRLLFKDSLQPVTGKVVTYDYLKNRVRVSAVKDGKRVGMHYAFFAEAQPKFYEYATLKNNAASGGAAAYYENGYLYRKANYKDSAITGEMYYADGRTEYNHLEETVESNITAIDKLYLIKYETGFYGNVPAIVMEFQNSSGYPLVETVKMEARFVEAAVNTDTEKEISRVYKYYRWAHDIPMFSEEIKQITLKSGVSYAKGKKLFCYVYIDGIVFMKTDVEVKQLG